MHSTTDQMPIDVRHMGGEECAECANGQSHRLWHACSLRIILGGCEQILAGLIWV